MHRTYEVLAQSGQVGTGGAQQWIAGNVVPLLFFLLGCVILWKGKSGDNAGAAKIFGPMLMGVAVLGIAVTNSWRPIAQFVAGLFSG